MIKEAWPTALVSTNTLMLKFLLTDQGDEIMGIWAREGLLAVRALIFGRNMFLCLFSLDPLQCFQHKHKQTQHHQCYPVPNRLPRHTLQHKVSI